MNSPRTLFALTVVVTAFGFQATYAEEFSYPSTLTLEEVQRWVDRCDAKHPRLLANQEQLVGLRESLRTSRLGRATADAVVRQADALLDIPPIKHEKEGRRLLSQSRRCVKRTLTLSMAFHLTGETKYAQRAEEEMLAVAAFSDWNPSHFLDVAEMTFAMAIGYDWLFHKLSAASRKEIRSAIVQKGVQLPFNSRHKGWVRARNNWGQVCHGGLTAGALAVLEDEPALAAKTVHNALQNIRYSMNAYAPNGSYPEGPGYWVYGTSYNVLLIAVLDSALGSDFGLTKAPGFNMTGQYPALACGPSGQYFNYADGGSSRSADPTLFWFARRFRRPDWLLGEHQRLERTLRGIQQRDAESYGSRLLPLALLWMDDEETSEIRMPLNWSSNGDVPITIHRSSWKDPDATFVGFKGGSPSANHGQMDIGSFVLDADGQRWAMDLGSEGYHGIESRGMNLWDRKQKSDRWTIFRQCNAGHNTLVIDGQLQHAAGQAKVIRFSNDPACPHSVLDMSEVYQGQADSVQRAISLLPSGEVVIQDHMTGLQPGASVRWGMITPATPSEVGGRAVRLARDGENLNLRIIEPVDTSWQEINTSTPQHEWDSPNRGTRMIAFQRTAPKSGELTFVVVATPGSCQDPIGPETLKTLPVDLSRG